MIKYLKYLIICSFIIILTSCSNKEEDFIMDDFDINDITINSYFLDLVLDDEEDNLDVSGKLVYINDRAVLDNIVLMIYPNAYNNGSFFYNVDIEYLKINGKSYDFDYVNSDNTAYKIELDEIININEKIDIDFKYNFSYWDTDRIYENENYFVTMFFYPFVADYTDGEFDLDTYTFSGESYFNEIGNYKVSINVPKEYKVGHSGNLIDEVVLDDRKRLDVELINGRDFSFSAYQDYSIYNSDIEGIDVKILSKKELSDYDRNKVFIYARDTIKMMESKVGDYPYDFLTIELGDIYGMESSTIIYNSDNISETTIVHEIIHQWIYSLIGNNQSNESFFDEALTSYITGLYYKEYYNSYSFDEGYFLSYNSLDFRFTERFKNALGISMLDFVDNFDADYGFVIYIHGATLYKHYVDNFLDSDTDLFFNALKTLYDNYSYKEVTVEEWLNLLEETTGVDITYEWFMMQLNSFQDPSNIPG
ncbi:hypothetical protein CI105_03390 [Candidatus Izimaplasma bacterium ZiA1]|uniref:M1 family aminopeptidase n=1 Tax=Candidatus Izimoplasma sp. ZiA1 TaxID=2024899 RepID=UPI000BAA8D98|nr:hypothetical protein CI105_03390 [Candidatus Izimaplasma bacterium ZiA1]